MLKKLDKSYYEFTGKRLGNNSQLRAFNVLEDSDGTELLNIFRAYNIKNLNDNYYLIHELDYEDRWDNLSWKYYGTPFLWWVIPMVNDIENPFEIPEAGTNIKILKNNYIYSVLNEIKELGKK